MEFRSFACADGPGSVFILGASLPQKAGDQGAGSLSDAGSNRTSGEVGGLYHQFELLSIASYFFQCHSIPRTEPCKSHQETDFDFAFLTIALFYPTIKFWNNGGGN